MKTRSKQYLSAVVSSISEQTPVIFFDTCTLLEILRLPEGSSHPGRDFEQYMYLAEKINSGELVSVTSELVFQEFNQHYTEELDRLKKWEAGKKEDVKRITSMMENGAKRTRIERRIEDIHTETRVTTTISKIWRNTILIKEEKKFLQFAYTRIKHKMAPSQNKEQFKDSYIWGTFLTLAHRLPPHSNLFFFTFNKSDYLIPNTNNFCPQIVTDLGMLPNVEFHYVLGSLYGKLYKLLP